MADKVNIFLDTTLTYKDPFLKNNFNRNLLKLAEHHEVSIYMSQVVYDETKNKFEENVKHRTQGLVSALEELNIYYPTELNTTTTATTKEDFVEKFDNFYRDLIEREIINIIELDNNLLPILVERSIKRIKPFGIKKQEFRDAITWLSYATFAERHELNNCFFITENVNDFCQGKGNIHPDLLNDSKRFQHYVSIKELFEKEVALESLTHTIELVNWVDSEGIDEEYIERILNERNMFDYIYSSINNFAYNRDISDFVADAFEQGYVELWSMDILEVTEVGTEVIGDEVLITGAAIVKSQFEFYIYNAARAFKDEEKFIHVGGDGVNLELTFTFSYNKDRVVKHFEVDEIIVSERIYLGFYNE